MEITLLLNDPPGGRCRLYRAYASALSEHAAVSCTELFAPVPEQPGLSAPAMLVDGKPVIPDDGVIISPHDMGQVLGQNYPDTPRIEALLDEVLERCMQEWS